MSLTQFRHLAIEGAIGAPTDDEVAFIEANIGAALPASFLSYLQVANGGHLDYVVPVSVPGSRPEEMAFSDLLSTAREGIGTFAEAIRCKADDTPRALLPFAQDGCGSSVFLDLTPEGRGSVLAFVRGLPSWTGLRSDSVWLPLAESFDAYVSMLRLDREAALEVLREDVRQQSHIEATEAWLDIGVPGWRDSDPGLVQAVAMARSRVAGS